MSGWVDALEDAARRVLPDAVHNYVRQGAGEGVSAAEAAMAWRDVRFLPHVLCDVTTVDLATTVLGTRMALPVGIAPTTLQRQMHPDGEVEMARGAAGADTVVCVTSNAGRPFAAVAAAGAPWWVQAYVLRDRGITREMLRRAVAAGAGAVVLTVDTPVVGSKQEGTTSVWDLVPDDHLHANEDLTGVDHRLLEKATDLSPDDIGWLAAETGLPVVVKGVLRADDARRAVSAGASGVWVSNHGGRQLDRSLSTARALPAVAEAVGPSAEVLVDGGVRHGLDVMAALALGARAVFVGRPAVWALATGAAAGVTRLLDTLSEELWEAMQLLGFADVHELTPDLVVQPRQ